MELVVLIFSVFLAVQGDVQFDIPDHFFHVDPDDVTRVTDETSGPIPLTTTFHLFDQVTDTINVNENGLLSFPFPMLESVPENPRHTDTYIQTPKFGSFIAAFWTDNMPIYSGQVLYKEYTQSNAPTIIDKAKQLVNDNFHCINFEPKSVFVATWYQIYTKYECVLENSIQYCDCLVSELHRGDVAFCRCRNAHSEQFCTRCPEYLRGRYHNTKYCECLDETDNYDLCICKQKGKDQCSCLVEHDTHYCDCLAESDSEEHAWNCSCAEKHSERYCNCLRENDDNEAFCWCVHHFQDRCDCYLLRSKEFCDCYYRYDGYESYCDCLETGKDDIYCQCVFFHHFSLYNDVYLAKTFCQCAINQIDPTSYIFGVFSGNDYCECVAIQGADQCEDSGGSRKRAGLPSCYDLNIAYNLIRNEGSTYQVALISDGTFSFVVYNFGYWSTHMADKFHEDKWFRHNYFTGVKSDDATQWADNKRSFHISQNIWCNLLFSNNGVPGQLIYRTDQYYIQMPDCVDITKDWI